MFRYGIQVALEALPERMPAILRGDIRAVAARARAAGYDAMELYIRDPAQQDVAEMKAAAADNGLSYCGICTGLEYVLNGLSVVDDDAKARQAGVERLKEHLDLGVALGCPVVVGSMRGSLPEPALVWEYLERLGDALRQLDAYAAEIGGELLVENINQYISNYLCTLDDTAAFIRGLGLPRVKLHIDTHSMHIEESDPAGALRACGDVLGYVHFSDSNRGYPGAGAVDFRALYHALIDVGYEGVVTAECRPCPSEDACAERAIGYMKHMEAAVRIEREQWHTK